MMESEQNSLTEEILERTWLTVGALPDFDTGVVAELRSLLVAGRTLRASQVEQILGSPGPDSL